MNLLNSDAFGITVAAILTLIVYSYLIRDNPLYRLAEHLLVATAVAYAVVVSIHWVLIPRLIQPLLAAPMDRLDLLIPLVLGLLMLSKAVPGISRLGNPSLAYLVGMGLALATGGAIVGTLIPQSLSTMLPVVPGETTSPSDAIANGILIASTIFVLISFLFVTRRPKAPTTEGEAEIAPPQSLWRTVGRWFMMITFGTIFGGTAITYMSLLVGRWDFLINDWFFPLLGF